MRLETSRLEMYAKLDAKQNMRRLSLSAESSIPSVCELNLSFSFFHMNLLLKI